MDSWLAAMCRVSLWARLHGLTLARKTVGVLQDLSGLGR
jgi:hypothetical protein